MSWNRRHDYFRFLRHRCEYGILPKGGCRGFHRDLGAVSPQKVDFWVDEIVTHPERRCCDWIPHCNRPTSRRLCPPVWVAMTFILSTLAAAAMFVVMWSSTWLTLELRKSGSQHSVTLNMAAGRACRESSQDKIPCNKKGTFMDSSFPRLTSTLLADYLDSALVANLLKEPDYVELGKLQHRMMFKTVAVIVGVSLLVTFLVALIPLRAIGAPVTLYKPRSRCCAGDVCDFWKCASKNHFDMLDYFETEPGGSELGPYKEKAPTVYHPVVRRGFRASEQWIFLLLCVIYTAIWAFQGKYINKLRKGLRSSFDIFESDFKSNDITYDVEVAKSFWVCQVLIYVGLSLSIVCAYCFGDYFLLMATTRAEEAREGQSDGKWSCLYSCWWNGGLKGEKLDEFFKKWAFLKNSGPDASWAPSKEGSHFKKHKTEQPTRSPQQVQSTQPSQEQSEALPAVAPRRSPSRRSTSRSFQRSQRTKRDASNPPVQPEETRGRTMGPSNGRKSPVEFQSAVEHPDQPEQPQRPGNVTPPPAVDHINAAQAVSPISPAQELTDVSPSAANSHKVDKSPDRDEDSGLPVPEIKSDQLQAARQGGVAMVAAKRAAQRSQSQGPPSRAPVEGSREQHVNREETGQGRSVSETRKTGTPAFSFRKKTLRP